MRSIRTMLRAVPWTSEAWVAYYEANARNLLRLPWECGAALTADEKAVLAASLQDFQLGESSDGRYLRQRADVYARKAADPAYAEAIAWFIREEQRHSSTLADFLRAAEIALAEHTRLDAAFRWLRHRAGLEFFICVLLTAEMIGKIYYRALLQTSSSPLLRGICTQLLRDEVRHLRFHRERLALMRRRRPRWKLWLTSAVHRLFFKGTALAVWLRHGGAFRAGGIGFLAYWRQCREEWQAHQRQSDPMSYDLDAAPSIIEPSRSARYACGLPMISNLGSTDSRAKR